MAYNKFNFKNASFRGLLLVKSEYSGNEEPRMDYKHDTRAAAVG